MMCWFKQEDVFFIQNQPVNEGSSSVIHLIILISLHVALLMLEHVRLFLQEWNPFLTQEPFSDSNSKNSNF